MTQTSRKLSLMMTTALFAAIIAVLAQITIPFPLVPITGQTLAIGLAATILGAKYGTASVLIYLLMGAIGLPVFAQMTGGLGILFGPTGGFLFAFIPTAFLIGFLLERNGFTFKNALLANLIGTFISLIIGTVWLKVFVQLTWTAAFISGFLPFVLVGILKAFLAAWAGVTIRQRLTSNNMIIAQSLNSN